MENWKNDLILNYKKIDLNEVELSMILVVDSLLKEGETFITPDTLSLKMTIKDEQIDTYFTGLMKRGLFSYDNNMNLSLDNLKTLVEKKFKKAIVIEEKKFNNGEAIHLFENAFARALSEAEVNTINDWIRNDISLEKMSEALNIATIAKAKSIRYVDKILLEWKRKEEYHNHGKSIADKWGHNIEETLEIANINWMED